MQQSRPPDWVVKSPIKNKKVGNRTFWSECGVGFTNRDKGNGESITIRLIMQFASKEYVLFPAASRREHPVE